MKRFFIRFPYALALLAGAYAGLLGGATPAHAQYLDLNFRPPASYLSFLYYQDGLIQTLARDAGGRLLVGGTLDARGSTTVGHLTRLLPTGAPDPTFNPGGAGANGAVAQVVVLPSGKLVIGGTFTRYNGVAVGRVAQLLADGTLDPGFNAGGAAGANAEIKAVALAPNGLVYLMGNFMTYNGQPAPGILRLLATGAPDPAFQPGTGLLINNPGGRPPDIFPAVRMAVDNAGRVVLAGLYQYQGTARGGVVRILPTGAPDLTFNPGGSGLMGVVNDLALVPTGEVLVAGSLNSYNGSPVQRIIRLNPNGGRDFSFTAPATPAGTIQSLVALDGGKIGVGIRRTVARLTSAGALDPTFTPAPLNTTGSLRTLLAVAGGGMLVGGAYETINGTPVGGLAQLLPTGPTDPAFTAPRFGRRQMISQLLALPNDSLLAVGGFDVLTSAATGDIVRLGPDGQPDPGFIVNSAATFLSNAAVSPTGRIFGYNSQYVQRLTRTGAPDPGFTFLPGAGPAGSSYIDVVRPLADGRVLVGGDFRTYNGISCDGLVRLLPTGAVDPTFQPVAAPGQVVYAITVRADGHLALFTQSDSASTPSGLIGLLADGAPDLAFGGGNPATGFDLNRPLIALPDTSLLVVGRLYQNGFALGSGPISRLTRTGAFDPAFQADPSFTLADDISAAAVQPDGSILFVTAPRVRAPDARVRRLRPNGALDPSFQPIEVGTGAYNESVEYLVVQSGQRVVLGGQFADVAGTPFPGLARLAGLPLGRPEDVATATFAAFPNPAHDRLTLRRAATAGPATAELFDALGRHTRRWALTTAEQHVSVLGVPPGIYLLRLRDAAGATTRRLAIE